MNSTFNGAQNFFPANCKPRLPLRRSNLRRIVSAVLLIFGIALLCLGVTSKSAYAQASDTFTGTAYYYNADTQGNPNGSWVGSGSFTPISSSSYSDSWPAGHLPSGVTSNSFYIYYAYTFTPAINGTYTFYTTSDDGVRVILYNPNSTTIIDRYGDHSPTNDQSAGIHLKAGTQYPLVIAYYENGGGGGILNFSWTSTPDQAPTAPTLAATAQSDGSILLRWSVPTNVTPTSYTITKTWGTSSYTITKPSGAVSDSDSNVKPGTTYSYTIVAQTVNTASPSSNTASATALQPPPPPPGSFNASPTNGRVDLWWPAVSGADSYTIIRTSYLNNLTATKDGAQTYQNIPQGNYTASNPYKDTTYVYNGAYYSYTIQAVTQGLSSTAVSSNPTSVYIDFPTPTNLQAVGANNKVTLTWNSSAVTVSSFKIYRTLNNNTVTFTTTSPPATQNTYIDSNVVNGSTYTYTVSALDDAPAESPQSAPSSAVTPSFSAPQTITAVLDPSYPQGGHVLLTWSSSTNASTYSIYRDVNLGGEGTTATYTGITGTSFTDPAPTNGLTYYYKVAAVIGGQTTPPSQAEAQITLPFPAPTNLKVTPGNGSATLSWTATTATDKLVGYKIYRDTNKGVEAQGDGTNPPGTYTFGPTQTSYKDTVLTNGIAYHYVVRAYNAAKYTDPSNEVDMIANASVTNVAISPSSVVGGNLVNVTFTLDSPAAAGGATITNVHSSNAAALTFPSSTVTIPKGNGSVTLPVSTSAVASNTSVTVSCNDPSGNTIISNAANVLATQVNGLTISPGTIIGGAQNATGTVSLNSPAPPSGTLVTLVIDHSGVNLPSPATVTVAPGQYSATFPLISVFKAFQVIDTITANSSPNTTAKTATITVNPATMTLTLDKTSAVGGVDNATGTVTLNAAPLTNVTVSLTSNHSTATVPATVTILSGQTSAQFPVTTYRTTSPVPTTITATFNGSSPTATLNVTNQLNVTVTPPSAPLCPYSPITFTASYSPASTGSVAYQWSIDGQPIVGETASTYTDYFSPSTHTVTCLVTIGTNSATGSGSASVTINNTLNAPTNLAVTVISASEVDLTWNKASTGSNVYRSTDNTNFTFLATTAAISYQDHSVVSGLTYYYYVTATDGCQEGPNSSTIRAFIPNGLNWTPTANSSVSNIIGGAILSPQPLQQVALGDTILCAADDGFDLDYWTKGAQSGSQSDIITYTWTCPQGQFVTGFDSSGNPNQFSTTSHDQYPFWVAPSTAGNVTLTCLVDDQPTPVVAPDTGSRNDQPLTQTVTVQVADASTQRVAKIQYSTDGDVTWNDVPQSGASGYPLTVSQGDAVDFKAIKQNPALPWVVGKPVWGGAANDIGETTTVVFNAASANSTDFKHVTTECTNTVSADVYVQNSYVVTIASDNTELLGGSGPALVTQPTITAVVTQWDGTPAPGLPVTFSLTGQDHNGNPMTQLGSLSSASGTTDSTGTAHIVLTSGTQLGTYQVQASVIGPAGQTERSQVSLTVGPPTDTFQFGTDGWQLVNGIWQEPTTLTLLFDGVPIPNRVINLSANVLYNGVLVPGSSSWAYFDNPSPTTDASGECQINLIWNPTSADSTKVYSIICPGSDPSISY